MNAANTNVKTAKANPKSKALEAPSRMNFLYQVIIRFIHHHGTDLAVFIENFFIKQNENFHRMKARSKTNNVTNIYNIIN
jgi:hypothetical protein